MIVYRTSNLDCSAEQAWQALKLRDTFLFITRGVMSYRGSESWPELLMSPGVEICTVVYLLGFLPGTKSTFMQRKALLISFGEQKPKGTYQRERSVNRILRSRYPDGRRPGACRFCQTFCVCETSRPRSRVFSSPNSCHSAVRPQIACRQTCRQASFKKKACNPLGITGFLEMEDGEHELNFLWQRWITGTRQCAP